MEASGWRMRKAYCFGPLNRRACSKSGFCSCNQFLFTQWSRRIYRRFEVRVEGGKFRLTYDDPAFTGGVLHFPHVPVDDVKLCQVRG